MNRCTFIISRKMKKTPPASPALVAAKDDYDFSNLPPEAFAGEDPGVVEEPEIVPKILSLPLSQTAVINDSEKDTDFESPAPKESSLSNFARLLPPNSLKLLESRAPKLRITALNELQTKLEEMDDASEWADAVFRGLEKAPGFGQANVDVNRLMIDIMRHVFAKSSEHIKKATVAIAIPFLVEKLADRKLRQSVREFLLMIAEGICPSFVLVQVSEFVSGIKGNKVPAPKTISSALEVCVECLQLFGIGDIAIKEYIPVLVKLLEFKTSDVKVQASLIACYIYRTFGEPFKTFLEALPDAVKNRLFGEFEKVAELPTPAKTYLRQKSATAKPAALQAKPVQRTKLSNYITPEQLQEAEFTKKWTDQRDFLTNVETALVECKQAIIGADLEGIMQVLKKYTGENNKNLVLRSLAILEQIVRAADKEITRYVNSFSQNLIAAWSDNRANIRDQATKTIDAFVVHSTPSPFVRVFAASSFKSNNDSRFEIMRWLANHIKELNQSDMERIIPLLMQCLEDKTANTRQLAVQVAGVVREAVPDAFNSELKGMPRASQRTILGYFESSQPAAKSEPSKDMAAAGSPVRKPAKVDRDKVDEKPVQELPKYVSAPTQAKKQKRLRQQASKLGLAMIANRQTVMAVLDKVKYDAQATLPSSVFQKLFSNLFTEQIEGLQDMKMLFADDPSLVACCSDIFVRWLATRLFDKNLKIMTEGINFLMMIFADEQVSLQEMEIIVPVVFWCVDSKPPQIADSALDLLFMVRTHSDPSEYSTVLRSCLETCSVVSLVHLFSELQFTVTDDARNPAIFAEIVAYVEHKSIEVAAACGGVLSMLARRMTDEDKDAMIESLPIEQREALSAIVPIEPKESVDFEAFTSLPSLDKIKACRKLLDQLKSNANLVQNSADVVLYGLLQELCCQETDWPSMKLVVFSLHSLLVYCSFKGPDLKKSLLAVTFFANRWQRKIVLMDGIAQSINSILFKLFEKVPLPHIYSTLLEGMASIKGKVPVDSFYCKCWIAVAEQINELMQAGDTAKLISMAQEQMEELDASDVRYKLCNALVLTLQGKKPAPKPAKTTFTHSPAKADVAPKKSPTAQKQEQNISKFKQDKSPRQPVKSEPAPAKQPEEHKSINDIRKRLDLLKSRWNNK